MKLHLNLLILKVISKYSNFPLTFFPHTFVLEGPSIGYLVPTATPRDPILVLESIYVFTKMCEGYIIDCQCILTLHVSTTYDNTPFATYLFGEAR